MIYPPKRLNQWRNDQWARHCTRRWGDRPAFKTSIDREVLKDEKSLYQVAAAFSLLPAQVAQWCDQALGGLADVFDQQARQEGQAPVTIVEPDEQALYAEIGWLSMRLAHLKKQASQFSGQD
ncbi:MAG: hypothetical protein IT324_30675 [Anaerolineae bacterium]|nr:hypothetical protein [Anaerolineae bacterium]